jgi:hypothetical protein
LATAGTSVFVAALLPIQEPVKFFYTFRFDADFYWVKAAVV